MDEKQDIMAWLDQTYPSLTQGEKVESCKAIIDLYDWWASAILEEIEKED